MSDASRTSGASSSRVGGSSVGLSSMTLSAIKASLLHLCVMLQLVPSRKWVILRLIVETLQWWSLVVHPHMPWQPLFRTQLGAAIHAFRLPLYDESWIAGVSAVALPAFWILSCVVLFPVAVMLATIATDHYSIPHWIFVATAAAVHGLSSVMLVPITNLSMSFIVCDHRTESSTRDQLFWFPSLACSAPFSQGHFAAAVVVLSLLFVAAFSSSSCLYDDDPGSNHLLARNNSTVMNLFTVARMACTVALHALWSYGEQRACAILFLAVGVLLTIASAFFLDFYHLWMNRLYCAQAMSFVGISIVSVAALFSSSSAAGGLPYSNAVLPIAAFLSGAVGLLLPSIRLDGRCQNAFSQVEDGAHVSHDEPQFPTGLPQSELRLGRYVNIVESVTDSNATSERPGHVASSEDSDEEDACAATILLPYISNVYVATDVEVACRILLIFRRMFESISIGDPMKAFTARIYAKGCLRFPGSAPLVLQFSHFLLFYAFRPRVALGELDFLSHYHQPSFQTAARCHLLRLRLRSVLNIADSTHGKVVNAALRSHKEVLSYADQFLTALLKDHVNMTDLSRIASSITARRETARLRFSRALRQPTITVQMKFARFVEQVLHSPTAARNIRDIVAEEQEKRRTGQEGANSGGSGVGSQADSHRASNVLLKHLSGGDSADDTGDSSAVRDKGRSRGFGARMTVITAGFVLLVAALVAYQGALQVSVVAHHQFLGSITYQRRDLGRAALFAAEFARYSEESRTQTVDYMDAWNSLSADLAKMQESLPTTHEFLVGFAKQNPGDTLSTRLTDDAVSVIEPDPLAVTARGHASLWSLGYRIIAAIDAIAAGTEAMKWRISTTSTTPNATAAALVATAKSEANFILLNAGHSIAAALNNTANVELERLASTSEAFYWIAVAIAVFTVLNACSVYLLVALASDAAAGNKLATLSLFLLIPRTHLTAMYEENHERLQQFDFENDDFPTDRPSAEQDLKEGLLGAGKRRLVESTSPIATQGSRPAPTARPPRRRADMLRQKQMASIVAEWSAEAARQRTTEAEVTSGRGDDADDSDEDDLKGESSRRGHHGGRQWQVLLLILFGFLGTLVALVITFQLQTRLAVRFDAVEDDVRAMEDEDRFLRREAQRASAARTYIATGCYQPLQQYAHIVAHPANVVAEQHLLSATHLSTEAMRDRESRRFTVLDLLHRRQDAGVALAAIAYAKSATTSSCAFSAGSAATMQSLSSWTVPVAVVNYNFTAIRQVEQKLFAVPIDADAPYRLATDVSADGLLTPGQTLQVASSLTSDATYTAQQDELYANRIVDSDTSTQWALAEAEVGQWRSIAMAGVAFGFTCSVITLTIMSRGSDLVGFRRALLFLPALFALTALACMIANARTEQSFLSRVHDLRSFMHESNRSLHHASAGVPLAASGYALLGDTEHLRRYRDIVEDRGLQTGFRFISESAARRDRVDDSVVAHAKDRLDTIIRQLDVAALVAGMGFLGTTPSAGVAAYDRRTELSLEEHSVRSPLSPSYSNINADQKKPSVTQRSITRDLVASVRRVRDSAYLHYVLGAAWRAVLGPTKIAAEVFRYLSERLLTVALVFIGIALGTGIVSLCTELQRYVQASAEQERIRTGSQHRVANQRDSEQQGHLRRCFFALLLIAATATCSLGIDIVVLTDIRTSAEHWNLASMRGWSEARLAELGLLVNAPPSLARLAGPPATVLSKLRLEIAESEALRDRLYLGAHSITPLRMPLLNAAASASIFGSRAFSSLQSTTRFEQRCAARTTSDSQVASDTWHLRLLDRLRRLTAASPISGGAVAEGAGGEDAFPTQFARSSATSTPFGDLVNDYASGIFVAKTAISTTAMSTNSLSADVLDILQRAHVLHFSLTGLNALVILGSVILVFVPLVRRTMTEEDGTRLLLCMIPQAVRDQVPAIGEFLDHGTISHHEKVMHINRAINKLSSVAVIIIDPQGTVLRFSPVAETEWGYAASEVVGRNVKLLMPESVAIHHDDYLQRYRDTGVKRIMNSVRRVNALRRNGTEFPIELRLRELRLANGQWWYIAFTRNATADVEFENAVRLSDAVSMMAAVPVFVIDRAGVIFNVNRAVQRTFGYGSSELLGRNIKVMMPDGIAKVHDEYLAAYQRTRRKTILDSSRRLVALTKGGAEVAVDVMVKEITDVNGATQFFVGYCRDITKDLLFQQMSMSNEAMIAISPSPVISINPQGTVLAFSPAAESAWGYKASQVVGRNVNMLMPDDIARNHDGYLQRYMKTGEKHILGSTRLVFAQKADKSFFPVEANIRELRRGESVTFLGYFTDLTQKLQLSEQTHVSQLVVTTCPTPIICITSHGNVEIFNPAAERLFGYRSDEVLQQNVNMLMPENIAVQHDGFLERYLVTGVKNVIGTTRRLQARTKQGRLVPIELRVTEVVQKSVTGFDGDGDSRIYFGYVRDIREEMQMQRANEVNTIISDLCTVPMISIDQVGTVLTFSRSAQDTFGYRVDEVVGENVKMLMPERIAASHDGYLRRYAETGVKRVVDTTRVAIGRRKNGTEFPVELGIREIQKQGLDPVFVGYARDVTEEVALAEIRGSVEAVIAASPLPVIVIDSKGAVLKFSTAAEAMFRWNSTDIKGRNVKVLMPPEVSKMHDSFLKTYLRTGVKKVLDATRQVTAMRHDGHTFPVEIMVRQISRAKGQSKDEKTAQQGDGVVAADTIFAGFIRDLSTIYVLRQSNELRDVVLNESPVPMIQTDVRGTITYVNPALCKEFLYNEQELLGQNVAMLTPPSISPHHDEYLRRYLVTREKHVMDSSREVTAKRRDGSQFRVDLSLRELNFEGVTYYIGYLRNMTQQLAVRDQQTVSGVVVGGSLVPLVVMDDVGTVRIFNSAAERAFGYDASEVVGKNVNMLQPPETAKFHDDYLAAYRRTRIKNIVDARRRVVGRRKNGRPIHLEITVKETMLKGDRRPTFVGFLREVADEMAAEAQAEMSATINGLSPVPLVVIDECGLIQRFSPAAEQEFGYSESELLGQNVNRLQPKHVADVHDGYLKQYVATSVKHVIDTTRQVTAVRRDNSTFDAEITVKEICKDGMARIFVGFIRNRTQDIAQERQASNNAAILNLLPTPFICINPEGIIQFFNRAATVTFGYSEDELLGHNVKLVTPPDVAVHHDSYLERYAKTRVKRVVDTKRVVRGKRKDGSFFPVEITVRETHFDALNATMFFGFVRDITDDVQLESATALNESVSEVTIEPQIAIDRTGTVLRFSIAASHLLGYDAREVIGHNVSMLMPEEVASQHDHLLARYFATGVKHVVGSQREVEAISKAGKRVPITLQVAEMFIDGASIGFVGFASSLESAIKYRDEKRVADVINNICHLPVVIIDEHGTIQSVNDSCSTLFEYSAGELHQQNVKILMPPAVANVHDGYLEQYRRTRVKRVIDSMRRSQARSKSGRVFPIDIGVRELKASGQPTRYLGFIRDVTEDERIERAVKTTQAMMALSPVATIVIDAKGKIIHVSHMVTELLGYPADEVLGKNVSCLMPPHVAAIHDSYLDRYAKTGVKTIVDSVRQVQARHRHGREVNVAISVKELKLEGNNVYFVGILNHL